MKNTRRSIDFRSKNMPVNSIAAYRQDENLSLSELGMILGSSSYQSAKTICASAHPSGKLVRILASHENLSVSEFLHRYSPTGKDAA